MSCPCTVDGLTLQFDIAKSGGTMTPDKLRHCLGLFSNAMKQAYPDMQPVLFFHSGRDKGDAGPRAFLFDRNVTVGEDYDG